jgi:hypothetical protein
VHHAACVGTTACAYLETNDNQFVATTTDQVNVNIKQIALEQVGDQVIVPGYDITVGFRRFRR